MATAYRTQRRSGSRVRLTEPDRDVDGAHPSAVDAASRMGWAAYMHVGARTKKELQHRRVPSPGSEVQRCSLVLVDP